MWPPCLAQCYPISFCITDLYETKVQFRGASIRFIMLIGKVSLFVVNAQISNLIALEGILSGIDANVIKAISSKEALLIMLEKVN
jgi:hypothetical protein